MKKIISLIIVLVIGIGIFFAYKNSNINSELSKEEVPVGILPEKTISIMPETDYKNISYTIDGQNVKLVNGISEVISGPGATEKTITKYFGNEVMKDLNNDGREDFVFLITQETGGSGVFFYVVAALNTENGFQGSQAVLLGDRIAPQTTESGPGNSIIVNYMDRADNEPIS